MLEAALLASLVSNYLWAIAKDWLVERRPRRFDFIVEPEAGRRIALEIAGTTPQARKLDHLKTVLAKGIPDVTEFVLVTPDPPSNDEQKRFRSALSGTRVPHRWIGLNDLPAILGAESPGDMKAADTIAKLQEMALISSLADYATAPVGPEPRARQRPGTLPKGQVPAPYASLVRQLSFAVVSGLLEDGRDPDESLRFGERIPNATIVLSDLKNFSSLVSASSADVLNESMAKYYRSVRDAVFGHGGMLDKFIGDAVLAVFGYPKPSASAALNALKFADQLITIGREVLADWQSEVNALLETGTRIGIVTGDVWPLNLGQAYLEIGLLGDTINLAARLEKKCPVDGILLDHRTRTKAGSADATYVSDLKLTEVQVEPSDAKGQQFTIRAWQVPPRTEA
jgi:class 3 adenylate cyclase